MYINKRNLPQQTDLLMPRMFKKNGKPYTPDIEPLDTPRRTFNYIPHIPFQQHHFEYVKFPDYQEDLVRQGIIKGYTIIFVHFFPDFGPVEL